MGNSELCELCGRAAPRLERHHLIPRTRHSNRRNKRDFDRKEVRERIVQLCNACHKTVHAVLTEKELEAAYRDIEGLRRHPELAKFIAWVRRIPPGQKVAVRRPHGRRQRDRARKP